MRTLDIGNLFLLTRSHGVMAPKICVGFLHYCPHPILSKQFSMYNIITILMFLGLVKTVSDLGAAGSSENNF